MIDMYSYDNEIPYVKDNVKNYINIILKNKKYNQVCTRMTMIRMYVCIIRMYYVLINPPIPQMHFLRCHAYVCMYV